MGEAVRLTGGDGFTFEAWREPAREARRGGLIVMQEPFGVTEHLRELAAGFAEDGYEVLAPSLFDRRAPGFHAGHDAEDAAGRPSQARPWNEVAGDLQACVDALAPPVFAVGWGWGGTAAWLAACRCEGLAAASALYGRRIPELVDETPRCPVILHFGRPDPTLPSETVELIRERHPELPVHVYDATPGVASDLSADPTPDAARLARLRTLALFHRAAGGRDHGA